MSDVIIKTRSIPNNPRSKNYPAGTTVTPSSGGSTAIIGGGGTSIDIVGEASGATLTDKNVLSSLRVIAEILSRIIKSDDTAELSEEKTFSSIRIIAEIVSRIVGSDDVDTELSEENTLSSIRSFATFLRKDVADTASELITFMAGLIAKKIITAEEGIKIGKFVTGMIGGSGGAITVDPITGKTRIEVDEAVFRESMIALKITFNCTDVISGDKASTFAFGTIKSVDTDNKIIELDLLTGQLGTSKVDDICRGVFHNLSGGNNAADSNDSNGFLNYAGFSTVYFTPTEILVNEPGTMKFSYSLQSDTVMHPMPGMIFYAYGNFTDKSRQAMTYETRYYTRRLKNVNTWVINPDLNIAMQDGLLEGLTMGGVEYHNYGMVAENVYLTNSFIQLTPEQKEELKGDPGAMARPRGFFVPGEDYVFNRYVRDIVLYRFGSLIYTFQVKVYGATVSVAPTSSAGDDNWEVANKFIFVAMDMALIDGADIAGFLYKNLRMISRKGTLNGVETYISNIDEADIPNFKPNISLDGNDGTGILNEIDAAGFIRENWYDIDMRYAVDMRAEKQNIYISGNDADIDTVFYIPGTFDFKIGRPYSFKVFNSTKFIVKLGDWSGDFEFFKRSGDDIDEVGSVRKVWLHGYCKLEFVFVPERRVEDEQMGPLYTGKMMITNPYDFYLYTSGNQQVLRSRNNM
ncbi:hypothetical protein [Bacteroides reticulotermitis]|uniref:hypothetical protein n=1 Tax=Bacteroides reticulotermitis TaxID=1133319 RepID=UPI003A8BC449